MDWNAVNFWRKLPKGFMALAPMEDVTDTVFREMVMKHYPGRPDVVFTEFANIEAILHGEIQRLKFEESQRPVVAQIWGTDPEKFYLAAKVIKELRFDGMDINLGCPVREVTKIGACSALIANNQETRNKVKDIINATKEGAGGVPVSVKTRLGIKKIMTEDWIGFLLTLGLDAITIHGRTVAELSMVPAHWDEIGKAVTLRNELKKKTLIVGNGDVGSYMEAQDKIKEFGVDGVMVGRGIFKNLTIFDKSQLPNLKKQDRIGLLMKHLELWGETYLDRKNFAVMKKFVKMYVNGWDGAAQERGWLMESTGYDDLKSRASELMQ